MCVLNDVYISGRPRPTAINIIQSSNNYNIVSRFICWNQNIVHMKILDTSFKMTKEDLGLGVKDVYYESKMKYEYQ